MSAPGFRTPMKATLVDEPVEGDEWIFERKLDGVRLLAIRDGDDTRLWSRNEKDIDVLHLDGDDVADRPRRERKSLLRDAFDWDDPIRFTTHRNGDWLKLKFVAQQELVIGGCTDPQGTRTGFGALLVGYHAPGEDDLVYAGHLRHPRYLGLRHDKDPGDVVRETPSPAPSQAG